MVVASVEKHESTVPFSRGTFDTWTHQGLTNPYNQYSQLEQLRWHNRSPTPFFDKGKIYTEKKTDFKKTQGLTITSLTQCNFFFGNRSSANVCPAVWRDHGCRRRSLWLCCSPDKRATWGSIRFWSWALVRVLIAEQGDLDGLNTTRRGAFYSSSACLNFWEM